MSVPPPGHVRRNRDVPGLTGLGDDLRFFLVLPGIQHPVRKVRLAQKAAQVLGCFHRPRAHEDRAPLFMQVRNRLDRNLPFSVIP